ncbi:MAG TPA: MetQ/NlpA family ABC transporter substrate-binding protein [Bacillota bacterium]|nr:MetQ/NlpA family ABC transporter substrate-binding protein [Bacillota bacterium]HOI37036.1 MetQ/NlpA family ABC transporter substrate-binding protein [Bacillota bacterium]HPU75962.1 MetQ/NlpA family ABC transporter substrate-binding protein [Bacillota bacterium]
MWGGAVAAPAAKLKVGATPVPHAEILEVVKPILAAKGIALEIIEFTDYVTPNLALNDGDIDANFFQHVPYLESFAKDRRLNITYLAKVHIEPMGAYSRRVRSVKDLPNKAKVGIPNDPTNSGRALLLLQKAGLIGVDKKAGITATVFDIVSNPKNIQIIELDAAQLPRSLEDMDLAIINSNFALEAKLVPTKDALFIEDSDSPYANVLAIRNVDKSNPTLRELARALTSKEVADFIDSKYKGSVVPAFGLNF